MKTDGIDPVDADYSTVSTITDKFENFYRDDAVPYDITTNQHYFYRVYVVDGNENVS